VFYHNCHCNKSSLRKPLFSRNVQNKMLGFYYYYSYLYLKYLCTNFPHYFIIKILIPLIFPYVSVLRSSYVCLYYDHLHTYISACKFSKISRNICPIFVFWILFFVPTLSVHLIWNPFGINLFLMQLSMAVT
jgi:hypothetical protein